jgi:hypothetical protein
MFQNYLACRASACADHKTVPRRFNHFIGDEVKVVNLENPFDLGEESSQEPEISAGHPYEAGGVRRHDSITILSVCALLAVSGLIAAIIPARRAASIDPMQALRTE